MSQHISKDIKCTGDPLTALSLCIKIANVIGDTIYLDFGDFNIPVRKESYVSDLFDIYLLKKEQIKCQKTLS